jgi:hypothetical protein
VLAGFMIGLASCRYAEALVSSVSPEEYAKNGMILLMIFYVVIKGDPVWYFMNVVISLFFFSFLTVVARKVVTLRVNGLVN